MALLKGKENTEAEAWAKLQKISLMSPWAGERALEEIENCSSAPSGRLGEQALGWGKRRGADLGPGGAAAGPKGLAGDGPAPLGAPIWRRAATLARPSWARSRGAGQLGFTQG